MIDLSALTWFVEVKCAGGWAIIGAFSDEANAWRFGAKHFDVRMWKNDECIGVRHGGGSWQKPGGGSWQKPDGDSGRSRTMSDLAGLERAVRLAKAAEWVEEVNATVTHNSNGFVGARDESDKLYIWKASTRHGPHAYGFTWIEAVEKLQEIR